MSAVLAIVLVFGFFQACAPRAKAQGAAPTWANGDWWEYTGSGQTMGYVYNVVMKQTVAGKQSVAVGGVAYETYHCTLSMSLTMTVMGTTVSVSVNGDSYHRISDLAEERYPRRRAMEAPHPQLP